MTWPRLKAPPLPALRHILARPRRSLHTLFTAYRIFERANMADEERKEEPQAKPEEEEKPEEKAEEKKEAEKQPEQQTMRSVFLTGYGGYNKLQVQKHAKPKPASGQVVVRVHAWWVLFMSLLIVLSPDFVVVLMLSPKTTSVFLWNAM